MFGLLKNKLKGFINGLVKTEEEKKEAPRDEVKPQPTQPAQPPQQVQPRAEPVREQKKEEKSVEEKIFEEARREVEEEKKPRAAAVLTLTPEPEEVRKEEQLEEKERVEEKPQKFEPREEKRVRELAPKLGLFKQVTSFFSGGVTISEGELAPLLQDLELSLLESDVSLDTTRFLLEDLRKRLVGKRVARNALAQEVQGVVRSSLLDLFTAPRIDLARLIEEKRRRGEPFTILFLGPNGMGKTTTISKIVYWLKQKNFSSVLAASDSFRAAALEQLGYHGEKLGVKVIKHSYGADPTAVAFDAIAHARAQKIDVVLVDTAGRQETSLNLVKEMEKMNRVIKPDLRVFVGEAIAGHALVEQVKKFKEAVGVDAIVLTKIDCDAKGGGAFSLAFEAKTPFLFVGTGQEYADLREFDAQWIVGNVLAA